MYIVFSVSEIDPLEAHPIYFDCFIDTAKSKDLINNPILLNGL